MTTDYGKLADSLENWARLPGPAIYNFAETISALREAASTITDLRTAVESSRHCYKLLDERREELQTQLTAVSQERDEARRDARRMDWAEQHPLEFLQLVLGPEQEEYGGLSVYSRVTEEKLPSGALKMEPARWDIRKAIDAVLPADFAASPSGWAAAVKALEGVAETAVSMFDRKHAEWAADFLRERGPK